MAFGIYGLSNEKFSKLVKDSFKFISSKYGFIFLPQNDPWVMSAEKEDCRIIFRLGRASVSVAFELLGDLSKTTKYYDKLGVLAIASCINPNFKSKFKMAENDDDIKESLHELAIITKRYCSKLLKGNFSQWVDIECCVHEKSQKTKNEYPELFEKP
jgi:hypothetical protein